MITPTAPKIIREYPPPGERGGEMAIQQEKA
jgi:hypothetical protein